MSDPTLLQYIAVAATAVGASIVGGVAGYGTGLLMPLVLVPIIGAEAVVPVIGLSALFTNGSRVFAYRDALDWRKALIVGLAALPLTIVSAYGYTRLSGRGALLLIGVVLIALVPVRYSMKRRFGRLSNSGLAVAGLGYGALVGGTSGAGVVLLSILMAGGLEGAAVIATDAAVSLAIGVVKSLTFRSAGSLPWPSVLMALLIGICAVPGAFIARALTRRLTLSTHTRILDAVVVLGGLLLVVQALTST